MERGYFLDATADRHFSLLKIDDALKDLIYEITSGAVRWRGYFDWILSSLEIGRVKRETLLLLYLAMYQLFFLDKAAHHVVKETVEYVKRVQGREAAGFVNAVLRRIMREGREIPLPAEPVTRLSVKYSFPIWIVRRWHERFGAERTEKILANLSRRPRFCLRVDTSRMEREHAMEELKKAGLQVTAGRYVDTALYVEKLRPVLKHELLKKGVISVQDEASQRAVCLLGGKEGERILDACCGLGTKGRQIKELFGVEPVSMDIRRRERKIQRFVLGDCLSPPLKEEAFDRILLDAPCSSLGIIRRHPEIKWRRKEEHVAQFVSYQFDLLKGLIGTLRRGGRIVYSVCSFEEEETEHVIRRAQSELGLKVEEAFLSVPDEYEMDGFFAARLEKP